MSEEDRRKSKCVDHGYQAATLFHSVGTCFPERTSVVTDKTGKGCADHVTQLIHRKACILGVLTNVDMTTLQCTPAHFGVEGEVPEARMPGKPTITIHHQVLKVVTKGDRTHARCSEVRSSSRRVGKASVMYPSEWNSFRGVSPRGGQATCCSPDTTCSIQLLAQLLGEELLAQNYCLVVHYRIPHFVQNQV